MNILSIIIEHKQKEIAKKKKKNPLNSFIYKLNKNDRNFKKSISQKGINLIGELKKASPLTGIISKNFNIKKIINTYDKHASAISIIVDEKFFKGSLKYIETAKKQSALPILCKDFVIDEYQIYEARYAGASAILLIASILTKKQIKHFIRIAQKYKMDSLVEVHSLKELKKALKANAEIIGINNQDLTNFKIDLETTLELAQYIPTKKIVVSESGIKDYNDIIQTNNMVDAFLVGTNLIKSSDLEHSIKNLLSPQVKIRGIKKLEHAQSAARSDADFLEFIFIKNKKNHIETQKAKKIIQKIRQKFPKIKIVGTFKNERLDKINEIAYLLNLDFVQLNGNENPSYCQNVIKPVIKTINAENPKPKIIKILNNYDKNIASFLLKIPKQNKKFYWDIIKDISKNYPIILSGGLNEKNIKQAIKTVQPQIVEISNKTEDEKIDKIKQFINIVKN